MLSESTTHKVEIRGETVRYQRAGSGDPLVLVHGLSGSLRWWRRNVPALANEHAVYLLDLPGYGGMRRMGRDFHLSDAAHWMAEWMGAVGIPRASIVGHSMGGYICARFAARFPQCVDKLVLVAPAGLSSAGSVRRYVMPLVRAARYSSPRFLPILAVDALRAGPATLWRSTRQLLAEDIMADLASIQAPTLLIWGCNDTLVPPTLGCIFDHQIPDSSLLLIDHAAHVPMFDRPRVFNRSVLDFLSGTVP